MAAPDQKIPTEIFYILLLTIFFLPEVKVWFCLSNLHKLRNKLSHKGQSLIGKELNFKGTNPDYPVEQFKLDEN